MDYPYSKTACPIPVVDGIMIIRYPVIEKDRGGSFKVIFVFVVKRIPQKTSR